MKIPRHHFLPDYRAMLSLNFSEKRSKLAGNELKMCPSLTEIFVSRYEGKYTLGLSSGVTRLVRKFSLKFL